MTSFWGFLWGIRVLGEARFVKETLSGAAVKLWSIAGEGGHEGLAEMAHVLKRGGEVTPRMVQRHSSGQDAFLLAQECCFWYYIRVFKTHSPTQTHNPTPPRTLFGRVFSLSFYLFGLRKKRCQTAYMRRNVFSGGLQSGAKDADSGAKSRCVNLPGRWSVNEKPPDGCRAVEGRRSLP